MSKDQPQTAEDKLDETLEETFPASDAPANTVETGIGVDGKGRVGSKAGTDGAGAPAATPGDHTVEPAPTRRTV
jgi:hypothetical protein